VAKMCKDKSVERAIEAAIAMFFNHKIHFPKKHINPRRVKIVRSIRHKFDIFSWKMAGPRDAIMQSQNAATMNFTCFMLNFST